MSRNLSIEFQERLAEVEAYLEFLLTIEDQAKLGPPRIHGAEHPITAQQQRILYSSVYLQLYNLVEATMSSCIKAVTEATKKDARWKPSDLSDSLKLEWIRATARTHVENLVPEKRLESALLLCNHLVDSLPIKKFELEKGGGGNWTDEEIEEFSKRLGSKLTVSRPAYSAVKRPIKNNLGPLALVKKLRNDLAHGSISFEQCAEDTTVSGLIELKEKTVDYLQEIIKFFAKYIENFEFIRPERRPA